MNERIKELAEQARSWAETAYKQQNDQFTSHWDTPIGYTPSQFFEQKFAELIVRECVDIADGQKKYVEDMVVFNEHDANWNKARIQQSQQIVDKIKQHFGVEE
jgi:hypothetical protein